MGLHSDSGIKSCRLILTEFFSNRRVIEVRRVGIKRRFRRRQGNDFLGRESYSTVVFLAMYLLRFALLYPNILHHCPEEFLSFIFLHCQLIFQFAIMADILSNILLLACMWPGLGSSYGVAAGGGVIAGKRTAQERLPARS